MTKSPKHEHVKPPALGAVLLSLTNAGDTGAASRLAGISTPQAIANTRDSGKREFHNRRATAPKCGFLYVNNKLLDIAQQQELLQRIQALVRRSRTPNLLVEPSLITREVQGKPVAALQFDAGAYRGSTLQKFVESPANTMALKALT